MKPPALVIFDIDGTLLQTDLVTVPAVQQTFASFGLPAPDRDAICAFFGRPQEDYEAWIAELCPPGRDDQIIEAINRREIECIGETGRLYPGTRGAIVELIEEDYRLAICSNGPERYVQEFVKKHRLTPFFDMVCARGVQYTGKIEMMTDILRRMPTRPVIVVGDRDDDIAAAHHHGAKAIGVTYGFGSPAELEGADVLIYAPAEIPKTVRGMHS
ncbi:MAG: adenosylhomocysteine nucleosidase [Candidatus Hydrogenedentes bacterium]|nr:adenosylhomocysteine nucleosidase [Candidatus Hydrogenedentota bacterium]